MKDKAAANPGKTQSGEGGRARDTARFPGIRPFDGRVSWKVPSLFDNDWVALTLARELSPVLGKPLFSTAYGCPACAWAGGRTCRVTTSPDEAALRQRFEAYLKVGSRCAFTFSRPDAGQLKDDAYCNMLLGLIDEYGGQAIVVDDRLARHIRETHPDVTLVASNNRVVLDRWKGFGGMAEADYYRRLLETYDEVVVRVEAVLDDEMALQLVDIADRVQILVNQGCARECRYAPEHIARLARKINGDVRPDDPFIECIHFLNHGWHDQRDSIYVPRKRRKVLADMGFRTFKLAGRGATPTHFANDIIISEILSDDGNGTQAGKEPKGEAAGILGRDDVRKLLYPVKMLAKLDAGPEILTGIPEALQ